MRVKLGTMLLKPLVSVYACQSSTSISDEPHICTSNSSAVKYSIHLRGTIDQKPAQILSICALTEPYAVNAHLSLMNYALFSFVTLISLPFGMSSRSR